MESTTHPIITPAMRAEASAWIARLHGPQRNPRIEAGFKSWLKANPAHALAFEQTTEAWDAMSTVPAERLSCMVRWDRVGTRRMSNNKLTLAAAAVIAVAVVGLSATLYLRSNPVTTTAIGEQRVVTMSDGSRIYLNTASRLRTTYTASIRHIELESGEALFQVAKDVQRPFTVRAGEREITALGTTFVVRHDKQLTAVTLIDGKVAVNNDTSPAASAASAAAAHAVLSPGERVVFSSAGEVAHVDRPELERIVAWQRGLVVLDSTPLSEAIAEMNRYSAVPLATGNSELADVRVSGAFRAGDSLSFAQAVATTYRLQVKQQDNRIVLIGAPQATY